ncbi:EAL domain-containing protein [Klenkia sp. PcliD-1-E]|uniref:putative bifunctional diguanylate cyclase/phosphodiesterase n=1 Tax=Klenkia sp. PcliD-1-E TaxID=2954492 RepID=UPI002097073D|nr:EAL domain-containing protein [Klenkia sp. PcliD-1-E]MCO7220752.1 EAL domain-containing protein [Klenkia sp. PcliD-1-E]
MLVLLPLSSLTAFAVVLAARAADSAEASTQAADQVRAYGQLARASAAVDQELLVLVVAAALDAPSARAALGITPGFSALVADQVSEAADRVRTETDTQLDRAAALPAAAGAARAAQEQVAELRAALDSATSPDPTTLRAGWTGVSARLHERQNAIVVSAASAATSTGTVAAIRDVRLLADLTATLSPDVVDYLGWLLYADTPVGPERQWDWLLSHGAVALARGSLTTLTDAGLRAEALALAGTPEAVLVDDVLTRAARGGDGVRSLLELQSTVLAAAALTQQTNQVLADAVDVAARSAAADGDRAAAERDTTAVVAVLAVLGTGAVLALVGRRVTRALRRLSDQADEVSQGRLVDVDVAGPREVRSVGRALGAAVGSLRRVQAQARAVARGDLADPVLDEPLPGPLGEVLHASVEQLVTSLRQRDRLQTALSHQAAHDPLTDLPNRARALELTTAALHRARRAGAATGLLFVDLDGFKGVNDRAGHAAGDAVLQAVGARMREQARAGDTVCRLGGDEFVVLVEAVSDVAELVALGERLVAAVSEPLVVATASGHRPVAVGASVGVAVAQDGEVDGDELLAQADAAVYRAKHSGRGRVEVFDDRLRAHMDERRDVEEALRRGLAEGEVHVLYQPVLDVASGDLVGFEALARWDRPGAGLLSPDAFVPVAEQSDLICELDRWVLRFAVDQLGAWRDGAGGDSDVRVAVNLSARTLSDPRITDTVVATLAYAGVPARCLVLEVAESAVVESPVLLAQLAALRAVGVSVALDDYGTGTTSIGALRHLPVDTLKVDGRFLSTDPADQRLVALMVATAHASGLTVVAEGVEDAEALGRLASEACDAAQGFHLSAPLPAAEAGRLFAAGVPVA